MTEEQLREITEFEARRRRDEERERSAQAEAFRARIATRTLDQLYLLASIER